MSVHYVSTGPEPGVACSAHVPPGTRIWAPYGLGQPSPQGVSAFAELDPIVQSYIAHDRSRSRVSPMPTGLDAVVSSDDEVPPELLMPVPPGFDTARSSFLERDLAE
eukprot:5373828-Prorocentrum_lima.AAC.1